MGNWSDGLSARGRKRKSGRTQAQKRLKGPKKPDADTAAIVAKVHELMWENRITPAALAERSGIHPATLYQYLDPFRYGFGPLRINIIRALARGCGVKVRTLLEAISLDT